MDPFFRNFYGWTDPLSFGPKFPEILVEWIAPKVTFGFSLVSVNVIRPIVVRNIKRVFSFVAAEAFRSRGDGNTRYISGSKFFLCFSLSTYRTLSTLVILDLPFS